MSKRFDRLMLITVKYRRHLKRQRRLKCRIGPFETSVEEHRSAISGSLSNRWNGGGCGRFRGGFRTGLGSRFESLFDLLLQFLAGSGNGKHLVVKELFNAKSDLDITPTIASLTGFVLLRRQHRKLGLPIAKNVSLNVQKFADFADLKVDLLRYYYRFLCHRRGDCVKVFYKTDRRYCMYLIKLCQ